MIVVDPGRAAVITYTNESEFASAGSTLTMESFETLPVGDPSPPVNTSHFTITRVVPSGSDPLVRNDSLNEGPHATDGIQYLAIGHPTEMGGTLAFDFFTPVNRFGINIVDFGDQQAGSLQLATNTGELFTIATNPPQRADGNELFFGISTGSESFSRIELTSTTTNDGIGFDEAYFASVPEPSSFLILLTIAGSGGLRLRRYYRVSR